jgi:hypothetical protein
VSGDWGVGEVEGLDGDYHLRRWGRMGLGGVFGDEEISGNLRGNPGLTQNGGMTAVLGLPMTVTNVDMGPSA